MKHVLICLALLTTVSIFADKERDRWERELIEQQAKKKELRSICYKVAAVSCASSFVGGTLSAILFYVIQKNRE